MFKLVIASILSLTAVACIPPAGSYGSYTAQVHPTSVFINGIELDQQQKAELDDLLGGATPPGRYHVDARGMMGIEGQPASVNLVAIYNARTGGRTGKPFTMYSTDSSGRGSSIVSEGGCTILSTPSGSLSSGC